MNETDPSQAIGVVLVEDDEDVRHGCAQALELAGFAVQCFDSVEAARPAVQPHASVVLLCDVMLPGMHATAWLPEVMAIDRELPMILMTGHGDITMAVQAIHQGAYDCALIADTLRRCEGDVAASARAMGVPKQTLYDKMRRLQLQGADFKAGGG